MKLALLSDLHANIQALDACLAHARGQGTQQLAFLGDMVGYGADPVAVMQRVMTLAEQGAWVIKGNHDEMALNPPAVATRVGDSTAAWSGAQLDVGQRAFIERLPFTLQHEKIFLVHASAHAPERWHYVEDERVATLSLDAVAVQWPDVRYVFGGHVHHQSLYYRGATGGLMKFEPTAGVPVPVPRHRRWLATVGSVGQPRDSNPRAMYAMFDSERAQLTFHRVEYNHQAAAAAIVRAGLPTELAERLGKGR